MTDLAKEIILVNIEDELKSSYLDYAMSVIVGRALPDVRDGLKPVHRRVLFAMYELNNDFNKPYKKSARVVGDVIGKYHPHGETAVYDTLVRMAQPFAMRNVLIDGQGNFGSIDGDPPAAMRYTEVRMAKLAHRMLDDLEKKTVDFVPNYDETEFAPTVLPTRFPNLLINGSSGIAVGMATNIPTHNLAEVIDGVLAVLENPNISLTELMRHIPGPDFPTHGIINGCAGIVQAYRTGRGRIYIKGRADVEVINEKTQQQAIIISELPFQVNKARLIEKIAEMVKEKRLEGISALRDESDKDGMRIVIELKRGENSEVLLNNLYANTQLQVVYGINMVALANGRPRVFTLQEILEEFVNHRKQVVTRATIYNLNKARERSHLLEGLVVALSNIDEMVTLIKSSSNPQEARTKLLAKTWSSKLIVELLARSEENPSNEFGLQKDGSYQLSLKQVQAILELKLHRLTGLEQDKLLSEYKELLQKIAEYLSILHNHDHLCRVVKEQLLEVKQEFQDKRRTVIVEGEHQSFETEELIAAEDVVVTLSHKGYIKYQDMSVYQAQKRGGRGKAATKVTAEDFVDKLLITNTRDTLLCFSNLGKLYWLKVYQIPQAGRGSKGKPIINLLPLTANEKITAILPVSLSSIDHDHYIVMAAASGLIKKTSLNEFAKPRASGIIAVDLRDDDSLIDVALTDGKQDIMLFTDNGKGIRFSEEDVRAVGRVARGSRGIKLQPGSKVISLMIPTMVENAKILTVTENGFGKRTEVSEYSVQNRGGSGVIAIQTDGRNGKAVGAVLVADKDDIMLISSQGTLVRINVNEISIVGRNTKGVRLINLASEEKLAGIEVIADEGE